MPELLTFTAFCTDQSKDTIWIQNVLSPTAEAAVAVARGDCADAWKTDTDEILVLGIAVGEVNIASWADDGLDDQ